MPPSITKVCPFTKLPAWEAKNTAAPPISSGSPILFIGQEAVDCFKISGFSQSAFAKALWENPEILKQSTASCPMKRIGEPDEIGGAAVFLASQAGSFVNGHTLVIDGGTVV